MYELGNKALCMSMSTVEEKRSFNNRQSKEAERSRDLPYLIAFPSKQECKEIERNDVLEDCPVTAEAINNAGKTFGKVHA